MQNAVTIKYTAKNGKTFYENVPADRADLELRLLQASGFQEIEVIQPPIVFRDSELTPVEIGDTIVLDDDEKGEVFRLFMLDGRQYAEVAAGKDDPVEIPLDEYFVADKEIPGDKAERFLKVIKDIVTSYGQTLNEHTNIKAKSNAGCHPALIIKSGPSPIPGLPYVIAVAYEHKNDNFHVLIAPEETYVPGFPIYVHIGDFTAKHLLDARQMPCTGFDEALDRMVEWGNMLREYKYQAPKPIPPIDEVYEEAAAEEITKATAQIEKKGIKSVLGNLAEQFRAAVGAQAHEYQAISPAEALEYARNHEQGARYTGKMPGVNGTVDIRISHSAVQSPKGRWKLQRYRVECTVSGRRIDLGGRRDKQGWYTYNDAYNLLKPDHLIPKLQRAAQG